MNIQDNVIYNEFVILIFDLLSSYILHKYIYVYLIYISIRYEIFVLPIYFNQFKFQHYIVIQTKKGKYNDV